MGNLADGEAASQPLVPLGDHHTFERLDALFTAFNDLHKDFHRVAGAKVRDVFPQLFVFNSADQFLRHGRTPPGADYSTLLPQRASATARLSSWLALTGTRVDDR